MEPSAGLGPRLRVFVAELSTNNMHIWLNFPFWYFAGWIQGSMLNNVRKSVCSLISRQHCGTTDEGWFFQWQHASGKKEGTGRDKITWTSSKSATSLAVPSFRIYFRRASDPQRETWCGGGQNSDKNEEKKGRKILSIKLNNNNNKEQKGTIKDWGQNFWIVLHVSFSSMWKLKKAQNTHTHTLKNSHFYYASKQLK